MNYAINLSPGAAPTDLERALALVSSAGGVALASYPQIGTFFAQSESASFAPDMAEALAGSEITVHSIGPTRVAAVPEVERVKAPAPAPAPEPTPDPAQSGDGTGQSGAQSGAQSGGVQSARGRALSEADGTEEISNWGAAAMSVAEAAGVPVSYRWVGTALPEDKSLQLTVFRIAQEALTNVLRYAPTTPAVKVDVERHIGTVILTVDNEAAPGTRPMHGSGKGLIGMRERASVYGGTVQAGPTPTGWRVRAVLRWDEHDEGTSSWQMPL